MTAYKDILSEFIKRSKDNLESIQKLANEEKLAGISEKDKSAFEVTQLINSLLGLVVLPQQRLFDKIPKTSFDNLRNAGWPSDFLKPSTRNDLDNNLRSLSICLRNGITHFNIEAIEQTGEISGVIICDKKTPKCPPHWEVILTLSELQCVVEKFGEVVKTNHP